MSVTADNERGAPDGTPDSIPHPGPDEIDLAAVLHALSDPVRLLILATIADGEEWTCGSLDLPVSKSTCTHHFKVLREAGVIRQRVVGTTRLNSLRRDDLDALFPGLIDAVVAGTAVPAAG
jgi:DNA-binding transcriptional ArsR family regulator